MYSKDPSVSVIVPTLNSERFIEKCLASIKMQKYDSIELIVVDNFSTDKTREIAARFTDKVYMAGPERCSQRNFGFNKSCGDYAVFIDSDMILSVDVISEAVAKCTGENGYDGIYIPEISIGKGFWTACKALERSCYVGDVSIEAARFFRRDILIEVGGYDEKLVSAEDWDLSQRIVEKGYNLGHIKAIIEHNEGKLSILKTMKKKFYYGQKIHMYIRKHPNSRSSQFTPFREAYLKNWKNIFKNPILCLGFLFLKFCEFLAGGLGYVKSLIGNRFRAH
ncbi:MAG: glycosyltransferase [Pseudomonadota bacterium]